MRNFKKIIFVTSIVFTLPVISNAQASLTSFEGSYLGANAGGAWSSSNYSTNPGCEISSVNAVFCNVEPDPSSPNGAAVAASGTGNLFASSFVGGAEAGHNWQRGKIVFGDEADFGALNLSNSRTVSAAFPYPFLGTNYTLRDSVSTHWLTTLRGRFGVVVKPRFMIYATGGAAITDLKTSSSYNDNAINADFPGGSGSGNNSNVRMGWVVGGGGEWLLTDNCSIKAEYLHMDFGTVNVAVPTSNTPDYTQTIQADFGLTVNLARIGLNYRF